MNNSFELKINEYVSMVNKAIDNCVPENTFGEEIVRDAMLYSLSAGGKRIRPIFLLEFCRVCGGDITLALPFACAVEMIHTYSLIHDDLPCMDDDDLRRGKPSCHKVYGEANALLAGDALLTCAFETCATSPIAKKYPERAVSAIGQLACLAGANGMIGGQTLDLLNENRSAELNDIELMDSLKTGALIKSACLLGCIAADADDEKKQAAALFAEKAGLAFQVVDDLLDIEGDAAVLGKKTGSDEKKHKSTYVKLLGIEKAKNFAEQLTQQALSALDTFGDDAEFLRYLAALLLKRKK